MAECSVFHTVSQTLMIILLSLPFINVKCEESMQKDVGLLRRHYQQKK